MYLHTDWRGFHDPDRHHPRQQALRRRPPRRRDHPALPAGRDVRLPQRRGHQRRAHRVRGHPRRRRPSAGRPRASAHPLPQ
ncbi:hypothetical protein FXF68_01605 [Actinomadura decatromicini]|uniref:Uncharacterized protein n=1 Tax=Actinomadura decatromicini TaxID=2604572 RepID=A0A5D3FW10_9ACTN|nr:hypothetical protein FXF68_01605 [Actinomadura decatromicini]